MRRGQRICFRAACGHRSQQGGLMPPRGVKRGSKRARQYEHIKESGRRRGMSTDRAEEMAARTVNKERSDSKETSRGAKKSGSRKSSSRGGARKSGAGTSRKSSSRTSSGSRKSASRKSSGGKSSSRTSSRRASSGSSSRGTRKSSTRKSSRKSSKGSGKSSGSRKSKSAGGRSGSRARKGTSEDEFTLAGEDLTVDEDHGSEETDLDTDLDEI
jgi:hypothetical protein